MIHINEKLRDSPLRFFDALLPEFYSCLTIGDFLRNKEYVMPTKKILPPAVIHNGESWIMFPSVSFKFRFHEGDEDDYGSAGYISDLNHTLAVTIKNGLHKMPRKKRRNLEDGKRLYNPLIILDHYLGGELYLVNYEDNSEGTKSRKFTLQEILNDINGFSWA